MCEGLRKWNDRSIFSRSTIILSQGHSFAPLSSLLNLIFLYSLGIPGGVQKLGPYFRSGCQIIDEISLQIISVVSLANCLRNSEVKINLELKKVETRHERSKSNWRCNNYSHVSFDTFEYVERMADKKPMENGRLRS